MKNPFDGMPENLFLLAVPTDEGMYIVHCKLPDGSYKTFPEKMELQEAAFHMMDITKKLGLPPESAIIGANKSVLNRSNVSNRKLKNLLRESNPDLYHRIK